MTQSVQLDASRPSATGLDSAIAAALAYLAGPFSGLVILLAERNNTFVRFHAWQAIIGLGGLGLLAVSLMVCAFLALLITPVLFTILYWMAYLTGVVWVVVWALCLVKAFGGRAWKLPLAGNRAEALAQRPAAT